MSRLFILGAGGHGRVVADAADALASSTSISFLDDRYPELTTSGPWPVIGQIGELGAHCDVAASYVVAIGDARTRLRLVSDIEARGLALAHVIHPRACVSRHVTVGPATVVFAGSCVNIGARLGRGVIVNTGATVDHDCVVEDGVHVCPGAHVAGHVRVGQGAWIGIGATVRQGISIGAYATIGAGAVVIKDVPAGVTVIGVPARARGADHA